MEGGKRKEREGSGHATLEDLREENEEEGDDTKTKGGPLLWIHVRIGEKLRAEAVVDTGATYSCINSEFYDKLSEWK